MRFTWNFVLSETTSSHHHTYHCIASDCIFFVTLWIVLWQQLRYPYFISKIRPNICSGATYCAHNMHAIQPTIQNCYLPIAFSSNARMISIDTFCFHFFNSIFFFLFVSLCSCVCLLGMFCCIVLELSKYCTKLYTGSVRCISLSLYQTPFYHKFRSCSPTFAMFVIGASNGFFYFRLRSVKCVLAVYVCAIVVRCCCCCNCLVKSAYIFHHFLGKRFFISGNFFLLCFMEISVR